MSSKCFYVSIRNGLQIDGSPEFGQTTRLFYESIQVLLKHFFVFNLSFFSLVSWLLLSAKALPIPCEYSSLQIFHTDLLLFRFLDSPILYFLHSYYVPI